jgi:hypothetical protein
MTQITMELQKKIDDTIAAWENEAKQWRPWSDVPQIFGMSRRRLPQLVELDAPEMIIETEISLVHQRIAQMREMRLKIKMPSLH